MAETKQHNLISSRPGPLFVVGIRRSGTTMMRHLIQLLPEAKVIFEPRHIWWSITQGHLERFQETPAALQPAFQFDKFLRDGDGIRGAKFALDPGVGAFYWRHLRDYTQPGGRFLDPLFVFIRRNQQDTYASYIAMDKDSVQGTVSEDIHHYFWDRLYLDFEAHVEMNPDRAVVVEYEDILEDPVTALQPMWLMLGITPDNTALREMIRQPKHMAGMPVKTGV